MTEGTEVPLGMYTWKKQYQYGLEEIIYSQEYRKRMTTGLPAISTIIQHLPIY